MVKQTTAQRLNQIMKERHLRQVDILSLAKPFTERYGVKLEKNDLSQYVSGKVSPGQEKLTILGLALNVSEAWLMGFDVSREREAPTTDDGDGLDSLDIQMMEIIKTLSLDEKRVVLAQLQGMKASREGRR